MNHFKTRNPKDTIAIIKEFFNNFGYTLRTTQCISIAGTYSCKIDLLYKNKVILQCSGKGITQKLSLASGYAELYERFCNICPALRNPKLSNQIISKNFNLNKYYFNKDEILITFEDAIKNNINLYNFYNSLNDIDQKNLKSYFSFIYNDKYIGVPFKGFNINDTKYVDLRFLQFLKGSTGMVAGNTLEEALNQGLSEICERYVKSKLFFDNFDIYYQIDKVCISKKLNHIICNIESAGNKVFIFDLSYNYNLPVVCTIVYNIETATAHMSLGSFPIFDIALERCLTENYQNIAEYNYIDLKKCQYISRDTPIELIYNKTISSYIGTPIFKEDLLIKSKLVSNASSIFITNKNISNIDLNTYFINLFNDLNINIYYYDCSKCKNMVALNIQTFDINMYPQFIFNANHDNMFNFLKLTYFLYDIFNKKSNFDTIKQISSNFKDFICNIDRKDFEFYAELFCISSWLDPFGNNKNPDKINSILNIFSDLNSINLLDSIILNQYIKKYQLFFNFINSNMYTNDELIALFNKLDNSLNLISIDQIKTLYMKNNFLDQYLAVYDSGEFDDVFRSLGN